MSWKKILAVKNEETLVDNQEYDFSIKRITLQNSDRHLVVTDGLSKHEQSVNEENADLNRIELYFLLPEYIDPTSHQWIIYWLNRIAQVPQKNKTWFGHGDTLPAGNPPQEMCEQLRANYFILSRPMALSNISELKDQTSQSFVPLAVIPIFDKEFSFKMRNSHTVLFKKMEEKNVTEVIDLYRSSVCRKRVLGLF